MRKKLLLLLAMVAVLTSACVKADLKLDVKDDGSGTYSALIAVNSALFQQLGGLSALDPNAASSSTSTDVCQEMIDSAKSDNPSGTKVEPYKDKDFCGVRVSASFATIDEGLALLSGGTASGGSSLENVTLAPVHALGWTTSRDFAVWLMRPSTEVDSSTSIAGWRHPTP